jgi:dCMP deaminase
MKDYSNMFMDIAERTALESNCIKYKVGAVIVKDNRIVLQGYNGTISGFINCSDKFKDIDISLHENKDAHHSWSSAFEVHAEMNIICFAARKGIALENTIMYCTHKPCNNCLKHSIQAGIKKIIYLNDYIDNNKFEDRDELLKLIEVVSFNCYGKSQLEYLIPIFHVQV